MKNKLVSLIFLSLIFFSTIFANSVVPKQGKTPPSYPGPRGQDLKGEQIYTVKKGDTLWEICRDELDDSWAWIKVWERNPHITNPNWIYPKDKIDLDLDASIKDTYVKKENKKKYKDKRIKKVFKFETDKDIKKVDKEDKSDYESTDISVAKDKIKENKDQQYKIDMIRLRAGFILGDKTKPFGQIIKFEEEDVASVNEILYINKGKKNDIKKGDKFYVYRLGHKVEHPVTYENLGKIVKTTAKIKVKKVYENISKCLVMTQFQNLEINDKIIHEYPKIVLNPDNIEQNYKGYIAYIKNDRQFAAEDDIVYIDRGLKDGIKTGMYFDVLTSEKKVKNPEGGIEVIPPEVKGRIKIINSRKNMSIGIVISVDNNKRINIGEEVVVE